MDARALVEMGEDRGFGARCGGAGGHPHALDQPARKADRRHCDGGRRSGPEAPEDRGKIEIYTPRRTAIIVEATPTPAPIIVYCNPGGQYYHSEDCVHVQKGETPQATLEQALKAGYRQCPECNAPSELEG